MIRLAAPLLLLTLSGCAGIATSPTAGPGAADADPALAARIFFDACLPTAPGYPAAVQALAAYPFTQNSSTGTYYHDTQNLSVKLIGTPPSSCSIVFGTTAEPERQIVVFGTTLNALADATDSDLRENVQIRGDMGPDGKFYANARTTDTQ